MQCCTDIHGPQRINAIDFGDPLKFHSALPAAQGFCLSGEMPQQLLDGFSQILAQTFMFP